MTATILSTISGIRQGDTSAGRVESHDRAMYRYTNVHRGRVATIPEPIDRRMVWAPGEYCSTCAG